jgi:hypothetical protein
MGFAAAFIMPLVTQVIGQAVSSAVQNGQNSQGGASGGGGPDLAAQIFQKLAHPVPLPGTQPDNNQANV